MNFLAFHGIIRSMDKEKNIAELIAEVERLKTENAKLAAECERLGAVNQWYLEQFRLAKHKQYGASSEKTHPEQLQLDCGLFNEAEAFANPHTAPPEWDQVITYKRKKCAGKRESLYEGLPTETVIHELPKEEQICPECGNGLHACGHEVLRRELEIIPAQVRAVEHVQTVYSCRSCEKHSDADALPMIKSTVPAPVISGSGIASPSLVAFIMCNKYVLALPLYRQEQELRRIGVNLSRQTMANWMIYAANQWLIPLYTLLKMMLIQCDILHADETRVQVIREPGRKATTDSYMWMYHTGRYSPTQVALFEYTATREGKHPLTFLSGFNGYLHVDAYAGYRALEGQGVTLVECWAHVRRKFDEALKVLDKKERQNATANIGLDYCNRLFKLERDYEAVNLTPEERIKRREAESKPIALAFFAWANEILPKTLPKSKFGQAIGYALNQQSFLMNFLLDGRLELSNNRAENSIRPFTVGRKNWLFSFTPKGANASAVIYSIVETAKANGLVPFAYLNFLFQTLPNIPLDRFSECLPWIPIVHKICKTPSFH